MELVTLANRYDIILASVIKTTAIFLLKLRRHFTGLKTGFLIFRNSEWQCHADSHSVVGCWKILRENCHLALCRSLYVTVLLI